MGRVHRLPLLLVLPVLLGADDCYPPAPPRPPAAAHWIEGAFKVDLLTSGEGNFYAYLRGVPVSFGVAFDVALIDVHRSGPALDPDWTVTGLVYGVDFTFNVDERQPLARLPLRGLENSLDAGPGQLTLRKISNGPQVIELVFMGEWDAELGGRHTLTIRCLTNDWPHGESNEPLLTDASCPAGTMLFQRYDSADRLVDSAEAYQFAAWRYDRL